MRRSFSVLNLLQAVIYAGAGSWVADRWMPGGMALYGAAALQLAAAVAVATQRGPRMVPWLSLASLVAVAALLGLHLQLAVHVLNTFTPIGAQLSYGIFGSLFAALPWLVAIPLTQFLAGTPWKAAAGGGAIVLLAVGLLPLTARSTDTSRVYEAVPGEIAARWLYDSWAGTSQGTAPTGPSALLVASVLEDGQVLESRVSEADSLEAALEELAFDSPFSTDRTLLLEVALSERDPRNHALLPEDRTLVRPGDEGLRLASGAVRGAHAVARSKELGTRRVGEASFLPSTRVSAPPKSVVHFTGWLATADSVVPLSRTWAAAPATTSSNLRTVVVRAAHHLVRNMSEGGRFAYVVEGPSGRHGKGYNYPRHAGGAWYLAHVGRLTKDPDIQAGAHSACEFLATHSETLSDGGAYVLDPRRRDSKAWVGTTALALLALLDEGQHPDLARAYAQHIASSVDAEGVVRGDFDLVNKVWPDQDQVTYAQGQGLLALAAAVEAGIDVGDALDRAAHYVDTDYWPLPAARMAILDEHWMCLAAERVGRVRERASGDAVCRAWVDSRAPILADSLLATPTGAAGAVAEAMVAAAQLDLVRGTVGRSFHEALAYADLFLANAYQPEDAPFLEDPHRLVGGFRDRTWQLDVRVDAVQHIGFALLGVQGLLDSPLAPKG